MYLVDIRPRAVFRIMLGIIAALLLTHLLGVSISYITGHNSVFGLIQLFDLDHEMSIPTFYNSILLLFASGLLFFISTFHKKVNDRYVGWLGLALVFLSLSIDEYAGIHEMTIIPLRNAFHLKGLLYFAWYIPYGIGLVVLTFAYLRFLLNLPRAILLRFCLSAFVYLVGAIGFETLGGRQCYYHGYQNLVYIFYMTTEEVLEMLGVALFVYALLLYIRSIVPDFYVKLQKGGSLSDDR